MLIPHKDFLRSRGWELQAKTSDSYFKVRKQSDLDLLTFPIDQDVRRQPYSNEIEGISANKLGKSDLTAYECGSAAEIGLVSQVNRVSGQATPRHLHLLLGSQ